MTQEEAMKIFDKCIEIRGKEAQSRQAMEECAELIQAINKCLRYPEDEAIYDNLVEEIGDVTIMLYQLKEMFDISNDDVFDSISFKAAREKERLGIVGIDYENEFNAACDMLAKICEDKARCFESFKCNFKDKTGFCKVECEKAEGWKDFFLKGTSE